jgi:hypothetical protein
MKLRGAGQVSCFILVVSTFAIGAADPSVPTSGQSYEHSYERSRFRVGVVARSEGDAAHEAVVGENGVFYVNSNTRAALAVRSASNAGLPTPFSTDAAVHSAVVKDYFLRAGIPANEVSGTHVTTTAMTGASMAPGGKFSSPKLLYYTTHLERSVGGIRVEGSLAFAALDKAGDVISEGVYWPALPADVIGRAQALVRLLSSKTTRNAFVDRIRNVVPEAAAGDGEVKIVHTSGSNDGPFDAKAVYVVVYRQATSGPFVRELFDELGAQTQVADEIRAGVDMPKGR